MQNIRWHNIIVESVTALLGYTVNLEKIQNFFVKSYKNLWRTHLRFQVTMLSYYSASRVECEHCHLNRL